MTHPVEGSTWPAAVLTSAYCPDFDPHRLAMAICVGYFEGRPASSSHARAFTVSGFLSSKARWRQFETQWTRALRQEGLTAFNGADFSRRHRDFAEGWDDAERRRSLANALARIAEQHTFRAFSCSLGLDDFDEINGEFAFVETAARPYAVCAGVLLACVRRWMAERHPDDLTLFVFEDGDLDHTELRRIVRAENSESGEPPQMWPRQWTDEHRRTRHLRPAEACDLLAIDGAQSLVRRLSEQSRFDRHVVDRNRLLKIAAALNVPRRATFASSPRMFAQERSVNA